MEVQVSGADVGDIYFPGALSHILHGESAGIDFDLVLGFARGMKLAHDQRRFQAHQLYQFVVSVRLSVPLPLHQWLLLRGGNDQK